MKKETFGNKWGKEIELHLLYLNRQSVSIKFDYKFEQTRKAR